MHKLLEGTVTTAADTELERLRDLTVHLTNQLHDCRAEFQVMKLERDAMVRAVSGLRNLLAPLWGEVQNVPVDVTVVGVPAATSSRLESVKKAMPGKPAELITLLQEHGPMSVTQIITLAHWGKNSVYQTVSKLMKAGYLVNNGGKYTLTQ